MDAHMLSDFPRGVGPALSGTAPNARFLPTESLASTPSFAYRLGAHFLGVVNADMTQERASDGRLHRWTQGGLPIGYVNERPSLTIAGTRSGKGRSFVIPSALTYPGSMIFTSAKDDILRESIPFRANELGQDCYALAPYFDLAGFEKFRASFNPLDLLDPESPTLIEDADLIADALVPDQESGDSHWNEKARSWIGRLLILHVATWPGYEDCRDLVTVYELAFGYNPELKKELSQNKALGGAVIATALAIENIPEEERGSIFSTGRRHLEFLGYPEIQLTLRHNSMTKPLDISNLKSTKKSIYIAIPAMRLSTCGRLFRMLIQLSLGSLERETAKPKYPIRMVLDEFAAFDKMTSIEKAIGQISGLGVRLDMILQDKVQLDAIYGTRAESFLAQSGLIQCFGCSDTNTLGWLEKKLGNTTVVTPQFSSPTFEEFSKGSDPTSWRSERVPLMASHELEQFFAAQDHRLRTLVLVAGLAPIVVQRAFYDKHDFFKSSRVGE